MEHLYDLPTFLRLFLFASLSLILTALFVIISTMIIYKRKRELFFSYIISVIVSILIISITRTPLISYYNDVLFRILNYVVLVPSVLSFILFLKEKNVLFLFDSIIFLINIPCL